MDYLNRLIGKTITDISIGQGTYYSLKTKKDKKQSLLQIVDETCITIEDYSLTIFNKIILDSNNTSIDAFLGRKVKRIIQSDQEVRIATDNGWISIDLRDDATVGPEAMSLLGPNNLCVVWN